MTFIYDRCEIRADVTISSDSIKIVEIFISFPHLHDISINELQKLIPTGADEMQKYWIEPKKSQIDHLRILNFNFSQFNRHKKAFHFFIFIYLFVMFVQEIHGIIWRGGMKENPATMREWNSRTQKNWRKRRVKRCWNINKVYYVSRAFHRFLSAFEYFKYYSILSLCARCLLLPLLLMQIQ